MNNDTVEVMLDPFLTPSPLLDLSPLNIIGLLLFEKVYISPVILYSII